MKKSLSILAIAALGFSNIANAQCINGTKTTPIYEYGKVLVDTFDKEGLEIVRIEYDLIFTKKETIRTLSPDWTYTCVAFADEGVKDLDLKIYILNEATDTWEFVSEEKSTESYAIVNVTPEKSAKYKFEVIVYKYNEGYDVAKYGLMLVHK